MIASNSPENQMENNFADSDIVDAEYVDIPDDAIIQEDPDRSWLRAQCERVEPDYDDYEGGYTRALEKLVLEQREKLASLVDNANRISALAAQIKTSVVS